MTRLLSRERPDWIADGREFEPGLTKHMIRNITYHRQIWLATPRWLSDDQRAKIRAVYAEKRRQRRAGRNVVVDHIVPVNSPYVCGLQVPWNLQIITYQENEAKSNHWWPDCPWEINDMFGPLEPYQLQLPLG